MEFWSKKAESRSDSFRYNCQFVELDNDFAEATLVFTKYIKKLLMTTIHANSGTQMCFAAI